MKIKIGPRKPSLKKRISGQRFYTEYDWNNKK
ncbi:hypothetical protein JOC94_004310 [Bacillus thermophilus]|uniref:Uncharacterized protein n=1 Tax=Siminovitchia thermophila TaxID=1245522 RepID=A0ABS2RD72_9BACI|nr:hypothetical protein [Siminovitchia thermophila]